ncbi:MAG: Alpha-D-glucose 1-phosphate phosphatase YihX [Chlamydiae bacterium]|nr:Alpha-D-glucose 1-phosphate phosphatase YihX [Chlamydiota bacterium]
MRMQRVVALLLLILASFSLNGEIRAIVFDNGGVVARYDQHSSFAFVSRSLGIPLEVVESRLPVEFYRKVEYGQIDEKLFWEQFADQYEGMLPSEWLSVWTRFNLSNISRNHEVLDLVRELKEAGYQIGMFSNVSPWSSSIYYQSGLYDDFSPAVLSCEIGVKKPNQRAYEILLEQLDLPADEVIFIDDKWVNIQVARKLGIDAIQFRDVDQLREELCRRGITSALSFSFR